MGIIKEPRKPYEEYAVGENVTAKLPQFSGLWKGVIVDINESRQELISMMQERQRRQQRIAETEEGNEQDPVKPAPKRRKRAKSGNSAADSDQTSQDKEDLKAAEKATKDNRLKARNLLLEEIISSRQTSISGTDPQQVQQEDQTTADSDMPGHYTAEPFQPTAVCSTLPTQPQYGAQAAETWQWDSQNYSYVRDLTRIYSYSELQEQNQKLVGKNQDLEEQNQRLHSELKVLRQELASRSVTVGGTPVTPKKLKFMKQLITELESRSITDLNMRPVTSSIPLSTPLTINTSEMTFPRHILSPGQPTVSPAQPTVSPAQPTVSPALQTISPAQQTITVPLTQMTPPLTQQVTSITDVQEWEKPVTDKGLKKIQLVPGHNVFILQSRLSAAILMGDTARKLVMALLDCFFSKDVLGRSCAMGKRKAHNSKIDTRPLPKTVLDAILEFVLRKFKTEDSNPAIEFKTFNELVNSKCGTARRGMRL